MAEDHGEAVSLTFRRASDDPRYEVWRDGRLVGQLHRVKRGVWTMYGAAPHSNVGHWSCSSFVAAKAWARDALAREAP